LNSETSNRLEATPGHGPGMGDAKVLRLVRLATYASVGVALILIVAKLVAWILTDSIGILSSLMDSLLDGGASLINLFAVRHALTPADKEHRFGHGKAEALAGLAQAAFISGSSVFLLLEAGERLVHPVAVASGVIGISVMGVSVLLTGMLVLFQRYVIQRSKSLAITADSLHYKGDLLANMAIIVALILATQMGQTWADPVFAIAVALYILYGAYEIIRNSLNQLMDRELPDELRQEIHRIVVAHPEVRQMHDLRTRSSGMNSFIQLHLELDGDIRLTRAHDISDEVEDALMARFPDAEVIIHQDPAGLVEEHKELAGRD
jgi:ferrous-iron efflux pump FieF